MRDQKKKAFESWGQCGPDTFILHLVFANYWRVSCICSSGLDADYFYSSRAETQWV